jgi:hypothetical protein
VIPAATAEGATYVQPAAPPSLSAASPEVPQSGQSEEFEGCWADRPETTTPDDLPSFGDGIATPAADVICWPATLLLNALWASPDLHHQIGRLERRSGQFKNIHVHDAREAVAEAANHSGAGVDVYLACAEFKTAGSRKAENVAGARAFWMDIDCSVQKAADGKGYRDIGEAEAAVIEFCEVSGLPEPNYGLDSGGDLHVYWALDKLLDVDACQVHARKLKSLAQSLELHADSSRTSDIASVMRMPGTLNYKYDAPRRVSLKTVHPAIEGDRMLQAISDAHARLSVAAVETGVPSGARRQCDATGASPYGAPDLIKLQSALQFLDPDCDEETWKLKRIAPLANAAREYPESAAAPKDLVARWSSGDLRGAPSAAWVTPGASNGKTGQEVFDEVWSRFQAGTYGGKPITLGTIYHDARQLGWHDPSDDFTAVQPDASGDVAPLSTTAAMADAKAAALQQARDTFQALIAKVKGGDFGAALEPASIAALVVIHAHSKAEYQRARAQLKQANKQTSLTALDAAVKAAMAEGAYAPTHHGYATEVIGGEGLNSGQALSVSYPRLLLYVTWIAFVCGLVAFVVFTWANVKAGV